MKLVYKKTIVEKMEDALVDPKGLGKEIEKFILTRKEWEELGKCFYLDPTIPLKAGCKSCLPTFRGIPIKVEWNKWK